MALSPSADSPPLSQPTYSDADINHADCPFALVLNAPLVDMTVENGSTGMYLGNHVGSNSDAKKDSMKRGQVVRSGGIWSRSAGQ